MLVLFLLKKFSKVIVFPVHKLFLFDQLGIFLNDLDIFLMDFTDVGLSLHEELFKTVHFQQFLLLKRFFLSKLCNYFS